MSTVLLAVGPIALFALVMGVAIGWDRLREPHRDPRRSFAVVDARTCRDARRRVERLTAAGDWSHAWYGTVAICTWLNHEKHHGRPARRARLAAELADWTARREEYNPLANMVGPGEIV